MNKLTEKAVILLFVICMVIVLFSVVGCESPYNRKDKGFRYVPTFGGYSPPGASYNAPNRYQRSNNQILEDIESNTDDSSTD